MDSSCRRFCRTYTTDTIIVTIGTISIWTDIFLRASSSSSSVSRIACSSRLGIRHKLCKVFCPYHQVWCTYILFTFCICCQTSICSCLIILDTCRSDFYKWWSWNVSYLLSGLTRNKQPDCLIEAQTSLTKSDFYDFFHSICLVCLWGRCDSGY